MKIFLTLISLALFESSNGIDRKPSENPLFSTLYLAWAVGTDPEPIKLQRQQIYFENGEPAILFCAAALPGKLDDSFNVMIPLKNTSH
jgi:hypothetical protein